MSLQLYAPTNETASQIAKVYNFATQSRVGTDKNRIKATQRSEESVSFDDHMVALAQVTTTPSASQAPQALTGPLPLQASPSTQTASTASQPSSSDTLQQYTPPSAGKAEEEAPVYKKPQAPSDVTAEDNDASFSDLLDIMNPLQHIPIIGSIYREVTGDTIKPAERVVGDLLFGAATGTILISAAASVASLAIEQQTGREPTMMVADALFGTGDDQAPAEDVRLADVADQKTTTPATTNLASAAAPVSAATQPVQTVALAQASTASAPQASAAAPQTLAAANTRPVSRPKVIKPGSNSAALALAQSKTPLTMVGNKAFSLQQKHTVPFTAKTATTANAQTNTTNNVATTTNTAATNATSAKLQAQTALPGMALPGATNSNEQNLGQIMQQTAQIKQSGGALPADLVHDMMMMALDKYKTAAGQAPSELKGGELNLN